MTTDDIMINFLAIESMFNPKVQPPVARLSPELLSMVFEFLALHKDGLPQASVLKPAVARVCRYWRQVALNTPQLWRSLNLSGPRLARRLWERSDNSPVILRWVGSWLELDPVHEELIACISQRPARISALALEGEHSLIAQILGQLPSVLPSLESLFLNSDEPSATLLPLNDMHAPRLRRIDIDGIPVPWTSRLLSSANLRALTINNLGSDLPPLRLVLSCFAALSSLQVLDWAGELPVDSESESATGPIAERAVLMPALIFLCLDGSAAGCITLLRYIRRVPSDRARLVLCCDDAGDRGHTWQQRLWDAALAHWHPRARALPALTLLTNTHALHIAAGHASLLNDQYPPDWNTNPPLNLCLGVSNPRQLPRMMRALGPRVADACRDGVRTLFVQNDFQRMDGADWGSCLLQMPRVRLLHVVGPHAALSLATFVATADAAPAAHKVEAVLYPDVRRVLFSEIQFADVASRAGVACWQLAQWLVDASTPSGGRPALGAMEFYDCGGITDEDRVIDETTY
ncbi:hypothetical protein PUNSTDRAFT_47473 [Punctularia strigosozonata HHB-11173 SS5]|uniref:F-box domain-containing protein n=1 Tax=Punctularia strigosozonata (strain HHB-11173) TaxID=741275 RepID=R7S2R2_PUNST|nr:uncharacterized protein PUNSTDRAFT_47473 [Punctularia strigosozonata HHB-11173 SS5]EIN04503.1 hypothetical protein PUNSTDRAFT_47473 [Punctularia strigosozonata HHB-11173 SS5]